MSVMLKVLVIDDEEVILAAARRILEAEGFAVTTAADAERGLALLRDDPPDIAVVDLKLPGMSGLGFLEAASADHPRVLVIVMTGYAGVESAVASLKRGAFDFLPKPFAFDELLSPVCRASRFLSLPEASPAPPPDGRLAAYAFLGMHGWARPADDGAVRVGVTPTFARTTGPLIRVDLPPADRQLQQGGTLARCTADDNLEHIVWSPVSGHVVAVNQALRTRPRTLSEDPLGAGWIADVRAHSVAQEFAHLQRAT